MLKHNTLLVENSVEFQYSYNKQRNYGREIGLD